MKDNKVSVYNLEFITRSISAKFDKPIDISAYNIEILQRLETTKAIKPIHVESYSIEIIHKYNQEYLIPPTPYCFRGKVLAEDTITPIEREVVSYRRDKYEFMDSSISDIEGDFFLDSTTSGTCFLVCLDDNQDTSYNHLIAAIVEPYLFNTYGFYSSDPGLSALDIKNNNTAATKNGLYWIQPAGYIAPLQVYCDMTSQGGGWTMCARWDRDHSLGWEPCLPLNAMRENINEEDMVYTNVSGTHQNATINIIPLISSGAEMFMHVSMDSFDTKWKYQYYSEIYQVVRDNPENIFDSAFDTNDADSVAGTIVDYSATEKNRFFDKKMELLSRYDLENIHYDKTISGGEGEAMFTQGSRNGAMYCSHNSDSRSAHSSPVIQWTFYGKDNSITDYGVTYPPRVGTNYQEAEGNGPVCRFNFIFIR